MTTVALGPPLFMWSIEVVRESRRVETIYVSITVDSSMKEKERQKVLGVKGDDVVPVPTSALAPYYEGSVLNPS